MAAGIRPINNIVDVTNYVMLEYGQPLHAFDADRLAGGRIEVRLARDGETMVTLDGVTRKLEPHMLVIADGEKPIALAGVMGGANSEVTPGHVPIVLESAQIRRPVGAQNVPAARPAFGGEPEVREGSRSGARPSGPRPRRRADCRAGRGTRCRRNRRGGCRSP